MRKLVFFLIIILIILILLLNCQKRTGVFGPKVQDSACTKFLTCCNSMTDNNAKNECLKYYESIIKDYEKDYIKVENTCKSAVKIYTDKGACKLKE